MFSITLSIRDKGNHWLYCVFNKMEHRGQREPLVLLCFQHHGAYGIKETTGFIVCWQHEVQGTLLGSSALTPTQVWRPERSERVSQETKLLILHWFCSVLLRRSENAKTIMCVTVGGLRRVRMIESSLATTAGSALAAHT